ncbi:hypothetical protein Barb7_01323 [Bacteroidales bacterium Barb7]|nr:hypothetical protein Barb7_01323 [Bacteroidales bacterium Barb7]
MVCCADNAYDTCSLSVAVRYSITVQNRSRRIFGRSPCRILRLVITADDCHAFGNLPGTTGIRGMIIPFGYADSVSVGGGGQSHLQSNGIIPRSTRITRRSVRTYMINGSSHARQAETKSSNQQ